MVKLPTQTFLDSVEEKKIYYFSSSYLNTDVPHHFICVKKNDDDIIFLSCCTSQFETVSRYVETRSLPNETLVYLSPDNTENPFDRDTYVNCNDELKTYTLEDFENMYDNDSISYTGEISDSQYQQILTGIHYSPLIEEEVKEEIPKDIDNV